jgi:hypothetical protein
MERNVRLVTTSLSWRDPATQYEFGSRAAAIAARRTAEDARSPRSVDFLQLPTRSFHVKNEIAPARRRFVKIGGATMIAIPLAAWTNRSLSATNAAMRSALKYQDKPNGDKNCAGCLQFVPGQSATGPGGCKLMPGDTEISPNGYCTAWVAKPK